MDYDILHFMSKTYSTVGNLLQSPASSRQAARGGRICDTRLLNP